MTIKLHIGLHKTATSSIQKTLIKNRDLVADSGWHFPRMVDWKGRHAPNSGMGFYAAFLENYESKAQLVKQGYDRERDRPHFRQAIRDEIEHAGQVLFTGESISLLNSEEVRDMHQLLCSFGRDVTPLCFVRSPLEMAVSGLQENVKHGHKYRPTAVRKSEAIARFKTIFGRLEAHPFAVAKAHAYGPVGYFIETVGLGDPADYEIVRENDSISDLAVRLMGFVNSIFPMRREAINAGHRYYDDLRPFWTIPGPKYAMTQAELQHAAKPIEKENAEFRRLLGEAFCDQGTLSAAEAAEWTEEAVDHVIEALPQIPSVLLPSVQLFFELNETMDSALLEKIQEATSTLAKSLDTDYTQGLQWQHDLLEKAINIKSLSSRTPDSQRTEVDIDNKISRLRKQFSR